MSDGKNWRERRREAREAQAERTGDTAERKAERARGDNEPTVEDAAQRASVGLVGSRVPFQG
jgi:hypothetical protein